ncbi:MAG TPA: O-antigen ligase family protein [bacterium]
MNPNTFVLKNLLKDEEVKRISKILLYFYFFFLIISNTFSQGLAGLLCIILIIRIGITGGRAYIATPFDLPFLVLIVCRFASTFFHYEPFQAIELVAKRLPLYGIYFVITNTVELDELPDEIERYIALIIYSCILGGLHGFYEFIFLKIVRPGSFAGGYSRLSEFSSVSIILAMFLRNNKKIFPDNWFYLTSFLIILGTLLITQSRAAWAGTGIALGILAIRGDRRYVFLFIAIFCIAVALVPSIRERAITIMDPIKNMSNRDVIWTDAIEKFKENPVLGYGIKSLKSIASPEVQSYNTWHSDYLQLLLESGIVGLLAYLWLSMLLFKNCISLIRRKSAEKNAIFWGITASLLSMYFISFFGGHIVEPVLSLFFFSFIAVISIFSLELRI